MEIAPFSCLQLYIQGQAHRKISINICQINASWSPSFLMGRYAWRFTWCFHLILWMQPGSASISGHCLDPSLSSRQPGGSWLGHVTFIFLIDSKKAHSIARAHVWSEAVLPLPVLLLLCPQTDQLDIDSSRIFHWSSLHHLRLADWHCWLLPITALLPWLIFPRSFSTFLLPYLEIPAKLHGWSWS